MRDEVYTYVFTLSTFAVEYRYYISPDRRDESLEKTSPLALAILGTCRRLNEEAFPIFLRCAELQIRLTIWDAQNPVWRHSGLIPSRVLKAVHHLSIRQYGQHGASEVIDDNELLKWAAILGLDFIFYSLLEKPHVEINQADMFGYTVLSYASREGNKPFVQKLLSRSDIEVQAKPCKHFFDRDPPAHQELPSPLVVAVKKNDQCIIQLLLDSSSDYYNTQSLICAAEAGNSTIFRLLLKTHDAIAHAGTPRIDDQVIVAACQHSRWDIIRLLLGRGDFNIIARDLNHQTLLMYAAEGGQVAIVQHLLRNDGLRCNTADLFGRSPIWYAARGGNKTIFRLLASREEVNLDRANHQGESPLLIAASEGHVALVKILLKHDEIRINHSDHEGRTAIWRAAVRGREDVVKLLLKQKYIRPDWENWKDVSPLAIAARNGHLGVMAVATSEGRCRNWLDRQKLLGPIDNSLSRCHQSATRSRARQSRVGNQK